MTLPEGALEPRPELVPRDGVGAAEVVDAPRDVVARDRLAEVRRDVVGPDRLNSLPSATRDRRDRREAVQLHERRQDPASRPKTGSAERPLRNPRVADQRLRLPLGVVEDEVFVCRSCRARSCARTTRRRRPRCGEEAPRSVDHDPLEVPLTPLADRDEVHDPIGARRRGATPPGPSGRHPQARIPTPRASTPCACRARHEPEGRARAARERRGRRRTCPPGDEDQPASSRWKFWQ